MLKYEIALHDQRLNQSKFQIDTVILLLNSIPSKSSKDPV